MLLVKHLLEETEPVSPDPDLPPLPASIELAWGLRDEPTRGPKRALSLDAVVAAGVAVARAEGLAAVSMGRVAKEVGASTMALYRYVSAKEDLLDLMVDQALGLPPAPDGAEGWRAGLTRWADAVRAVYQRHPWSLKVPITGPPLGPNNVTWLESALAAMAGTPLTEQQKLSTVLLLSGFVRNEANLTADIANAADGSLVMPGYVALLQRLIDERSFPALTRALAGGDLDDDDDMDAEYDFGLARILDGIQALIDAQQPRRRRRSS